MVASLLGAIGMSDTKTPRFDRRNSSVLQTGAVARQHVKTHAPLLSCTYADEPDNAAVWYAMNDGKLTEILVKRNQNALLLINVSQNLVVTWVFRLIPDPDRVVTSRSKLRTHPAPHARIEQELHVPVFRIRGSTRSWATSLWA